MALCFLLSLVNSMDRAIISFAIEPIKHDFGLDNISFGVLISAFALGSVSVNAAGRLAAGSIQRAHHLDRQYLFPVRGHGFSG
ncbi:MAG: hypothetical protein ABFS45_25025, partial [Pseudomonadota bacterium]